jgi:UPF0755 protein
VVVCISLYFFLPPFDKERDPASLFRVHPGMSLKEISKGLEDAGVVRNASAFNLYAKLGGIDKHIKAGNYRFPLGVTLPTVASMLRNGDTAKSKVVIPEGFVARAIGEELEKEGVCSRVSFLSATADKDFVRGLGIDAGNLEGFLFPDTYYFDLESDPYDVAKEMVLNFRKATASIAGDTVHFGSKEFYNKVILASIVEREYRVPEEAKLIASVFYNRLKIGMALQSCATVVYVMTEKLGKPHPEVVTYDDLALKDPYNTYLHPGLPPGPISNPGRIALDAVFNPVKSQYLYFRLLSAESGRHKFSKTFDEHVEAAIPVKGY